jgi:C4-dicarboxylate transporter DctQ subunit
MNRFSRQRRNMLLSLAEVVPKISLVACGCSIGLAMVFVVLGVVGREILNISLPFAIEFSEYLIPVSCYWGAAYTLRENGHVNADVLVHRLSKRTQEWFLFVGYILGIPYLFVITVQLFKVVIASHSGGYVSMYPLETPLWYPQLLVWIGLVFLDIQLIFEIIRKAQRMFVKYKQEGEHTSPNASIGIRDD